MLRMKEYPRCHGNMHSDKDRYGEYRSYVQCGYVLDLESLGDDLSSLRHINDGTGGPARYPRR